MTDAERSPAGTDEIADAAIQYTGNRRLPGTWTQYIGLAYDATASPQWSPNAEASTFVQGDVIITI